MRRRAGQRRLRGGPYGRKGSKVRLAPAVVSLADRIPHTKFGELFAGTCAVTLAKSPTQWEFVNDLDQWISNFLAVCRDRQRATELLFIRLSDWARRLTTDGFRSKKMQPLYGDDGQSLIV